MEHKNSGETAAPSVSIVLDEHGCGQVTIGGATVPVEAESLGEGRAAAIRAVSRRADELGYSLLVSATTPEGTVTLRVGADGSVTADGPTNAPRQPAGNRDGAPRVTPPTAPEAHRLNSSTIADGAEEPATSTMQLDSAEVTAQTTQDAAATMEGAGVDGQAPWVIAPATPRPRPANGDETLVVPATLVPTRGAAVAARGDVGAPPAVTTAPASGRVRAFAAVGVVAGLAAVVGGLLAAGAVVMVIGDDRAPAAAVEPSPSASSPVAPTPSASPSPSPTSSATAKPKAPAPQVAGLAATAAKGKKKGVVVVNLTVRGTGKVPVAVRVGNKKDEFQVDLGKGDRRQVTRQVKGIKDKRVTWTVAAKGSQVSGRVTAR
ncbi:hypothetical protein [Isoptericola sp. NPDC055881]